MANRYANLVGSNKIKDEWQKINTGFDLVQQDVDQLQADLSQEIADREAAVEYVDQRVDNIIVGGGPDKDPELVDIRNLDPSYTPQREINVAGDVTRDMQAQFAAHKEETVNWQRFELTSPSGRGKGGFIDSDLNDVIETGQYAVSTALNRPIETTGTIYVMRRSDTTVTQLWLTASSANQYRDRVFVRSSTDAGATWSAWVELISSNGGTMTGSLVISDGSNFRYVRSERVVSDVVYGTEIGVSPFGEAQIVRRNEGNIDGSIRIEGIGKYNFDGTKLYIGSGSPDGVVAAPVGSLYLRTDGSTSTTLYVKTSGTGNTGWTAK